MVNMEYRDFGKYGDFDDNGMYNGNFANMVNLVVYTTIYETTFKAEIILLLFMF